MLTFRTVRKALLFDFKWTICHAIERLLRKIDYTGNFYERAVGLISATRIHDDCGKIYSLGTSFLLASGHINVSHAVNQTNQSPREKERSASLGIILGFHAFILVFTAIWLIFWFLRKAMAYPMAYPRFCPYPLQQPLLQFSSHVRCASLRNLTLRNSEYE